MLTQRRLAARLLKVGINRVWIDPDPEVREEIEGAVTREDIRRLIKEGIIKKRPEKGTSRARARKIARQRAKGRRRGHGSRKGKMGARYPRKKRWIATIRALRDELRKLREAGRIDRHAYRRLYLLAKGGSFKSRAHLLAYAKEQGFIKE